MPVGRNCTKPLCQFRVRSLVWRSRLLQYIVFTCCSKYCCSSEHCIVIISYCFYYSAPSIHISNHVLPSTTPVEISRIMLPDDSNTSGNVHGGTILKMLEQAGHVVTSRYCNQGMDTNNLPITTVLVRLEKMDFHQPMHVGEVAQLQAAITYTSSHSLEVTVDVWAENVLRGQRRNTNTATLWYVAVTSDPKTVFQARVGGHCDQLRTLIASVPQLKGLSEAEKNAGKRRYEAQKASRMARSSESEVGTNNEVPAHIYHYPKEVGEAMVLTSQSTLANVVLPSDCTLTGHMMGGALMKMMDNAAGICACRHCHGHTVTACIDVINFHQTVTCGDIVFVTARMIFTSSKSMEIEVRVIYNVMNNMCVHVRACAKGDMLSVTCTGDHRGRGP